MIPTHATTGSPTHRVRKPHIVQFAPDGAEVLHWDRRGAVRGLPPAIPVGSSWC